jgi:ABC-2 type transport system permease protein
VTPHRSPVIAAKLAVSGVVGLAFGLVAEGLMAGAASAALAARGIDIQLTSGDYVRLLLGGMVGAAFWTAIGLGVGAIVRNQVATLVGLCAWLLLVEEILPDSAARYTPGTAGVALAIRASGTELASRVPALATGVLALIVCAAAVSVAGWRSTLDRDAT